MFQPNTLAPRMMDGVASGTDVRAVMRGLPLGRQISSPPANGNDPPHRVCPAASCSASGRSARLGSVHLMVRSPSHRNLRRRTCRALGGARALRRRAIASRCSTSSTRRGRWAPASSFSPRALPCWTGWGSVSASAGSAPASTGFTARPAGRAAWCSTCATMCWARSAALRSTGRRCSMCCMMRSGRRASKSKPRVRSRVWMDSSVILNQGRREGPFDLVIDALGSRSPLIAHAAGPDYRSALGYGAIWASLPWPGAPFDPQRAGAALRQGLGDDRRAAHRAAGGGCSGAGSLLLEPQDGGLRGWRAGRARCSGRHRCCGTGRSAAGLLDTVTSPDQMVMASYDHHTLSTAVRPPAGVHRRQRPFYQPATGAGRQHGAAGRARRWRSRFKENADLQDALESYAKARRFHVKLYQGLSRRVHALLPVGLDAAAAGAGSSGCGHQPHRPGAEVAGRGSSSGNFGLPRTCTGGTPRAWCPCSFGLALKTGCR